MSKELPFIIYCIEEYKNQMDMIGKDVVNLFDKYHIFEYIKTCYEVLHTTGSKYIVEDINTFINTRKNIN